MNCKFHSTEEAVTTCANCGAGMCSHCKEDAFFCTKEDEPFCLECSLKEAEKDLEDEKKDQKDTWIRGIIASIVWIAGACLFRGFDDSHWKISVLMMVGSSIFFYGLRSMLMAESEEKGFFEKIKDIFWQIIFGILLLPIFVIWFLISNKIAMIKSKSKVNKIKAALENAN